MEQKQYEKKMRIQLYDPEMNQVSDRLVAQDTEFNHGPKEKHEGPMRIEFSLFSKEDIDPCLDYIKKLSGIIPMEGMKTKKKKIKVDSTKDKKELYVEWRADHAYLGTPTFEDAVGNLRAQEWVFISYDILKLYGIQINLKNDSHEGYYFLIRLIKRAKNPANDKYDPTMIFAVNIAEEKDHRLIYTYIYGEFLESFKLPTKKKSFKLKEREALRFPAYMVEEERFKFSKEHRELITEGSTAEPSKFYKRWKQYVTLNGKPIE